jgi:hypothetical protein
LEQLGFSSTVLAPVALHLTTYDARIELHCQREIILLHLFGLVANNLLKMPKAVNPSVPLSGLFGLLKPSGPTSMSLLEQLKSLFRESALFVPDDAEREAFIEARRNGKVQVGRNKKFKNPVKIGQGGTLDPLADGVLGPSRCTSFAIHAPHFLLKRSLSSLGCRDLPQLLG